MATNSAGQVSVRFSVQDAEVVRAALEKLGKDGQKALKDFDTSAQPVSKSLGAVDTVANGLKGKVTALAQSLGMVGSGLLALGPAGLVAAAAIGGAALLFSSASDRAEAFAEKAKAAKESAESAGLTITQWKLLSQAGGKVGLDSEQTAAFVERLTVQFDELRRGSGPLFDQLLRIDSGLVRQVAAAKDTASALDILADAYSRATDQAQKNALARAIGGRGGIPGGRLLDYVAEQGGMKGIEQSATAAGKSIDENLIKRAAQLKIDIDEIKKRTDAAWSRIFSIEVLEQQKRSAEFWERIAAASERAAKYVASAEKRQSQASPFARRFRGVDRQYSGDVGALTPEQLSKTPRVLDKGSTPQAVDVPLPQERPEITAPRLASVDLALMQKWTSVLGAAITPAEALRQEQLRLAAAVEKGGVSEAVAKRALDAFNLSLEQSALAIRQRLGVASESEILDVRRAELAKTVADGIVKGDREIALAEQLIQKEAKETNNQIQVRASLVPSVTKFAQDAENFNQNIDRAGADTLNNMGSGIVDFVTKTKTGSEAVKDFGASFIRTLAQMDVQMTIMAPIAKALSATLNGLTGGGIGGGILSLFGFANGGIMSSAGPLPLRMFADGGVTNRPSLFMTSENYQPEAIVPLRGGAIPVQLSRGANDNVGSPSMAIALTVDLAGAVGKEEIAQVARAEALAGITAALAHYDSTLSDRLRKKTQRGLY